MLLVNDGLSSGQVKGWPLGFGVQASMHKEVLAILSADFFPGDSLCLAQNNSDTLAGQRGTLGERLSVATITIIFWIVCQAFSRISFTLFASSSESTAA